MNAMQTELAELLSSQRGHFRLESGHHGDLWLDLERLCVNPERVRKFAVELARRMASDRVDGICGPLIEGAFVAQLVALELEVPFFYSERIPAPGTDLPTYHIPNGQRDLLPGRRVAIVDDVVNAGFAIRSTAADLRLGGAIPVVVAALAVACDNASRPPVAGLELVRIVDLPGRIWAPETCPLCDAGEPLSDPAGHGDGTSHE